MVSRILSKSDDDAQGYLTERGFTDAKAALSNLRLLSATPLDRILDDICALSLNSPSPNGALNNLDSIAAALPAEILSRLAEKPDSVSGLITVCGSSPFLSNILARNTAQLERLFLLGGLGEVKDTGIFAAELGAQTSSADDYGAMARALRLYKQKEYARIGSRDLLGIAGVRETTAELSDLACACLDAAVSFSIKNHKKNYGAPLYAAGGGLVAEAGFSVIAMGKLGGRELNFSSDIDVIYIYSSDDGETGGIDGVENSRITLHDFFVKVSTTVTKLLSAVTEDGFVFRVDLDLRPDGRGGEMANSLRSAEIYYESWGQTWERAAMIKARPAAGDASLGEAFLEMIRPFVYRRYLDFTLLEEIKSMKEKIDLSLLRRNPDAVDVKLGAGGIREIEFFCQAHALIHGGKDPDVRERNTLETIEKLRSKGFLKPSDAQTLRDGYVFLRNVEHRLQIVDGRQTQAVPARAEEIERLARMLGFKDAPGAKAGDLFWDEYKKRTAAVHSIYRSLFYRSEVEIIEVPDDVRLLFSDTSEQDAVVILEKLGFRDTVTALKNLARLKNPASFARAGGRARFLVEKLGPAFLWKASASPDADMALAHTERFLSAVGGRTAFLSLLHENPRALDELIKIFGTSVFLSRGLIDRPENLDLLLSKELSVPYRTRADFFEEFLSITASSVDYEEKLDELRRIRNQEVLRIGSNDVGGVITQRQVSAQMTFLAEASLEAAYKLASGELTRVYGTPEGASFTVLGLGKFGAKELIYGSDLDIVFVYRCPEELMTTGPKVISAHEFFVKLGQRIISVLTLKTKEGSVFNVDTRLRPSGSSGPLVVSSEAIINYHRGEKTPVWERQSLVKARPVAADAGLGKEVLDGLAEIVYGRGVGREDLREIMRVRQRMEIEIAKEDSSRYNIKTGRGGIVDIEFLTQALQLAYGKDNYGLRSQYTLKALKRLHKGGHLSAADRTELKEAYGFFRTIETMLRVVHDRPEGYLYRGSEELAALAKRAGYPGPDGLLSEYASRSTRTRELYTKILEGLLKKL